MLNKSIDFFKTHDQFTFNEFKDEVINDNALAESFSSYKNQYETINHVQIDTDFEISPSALKRQERIFKSVVKLDKNFHIYIHGNSNLIEKGTDDTLGMKYYKLYYREES